MTSLLADAPKAVLAVPPVLLKSACCPTAVLPLPTLLLKRARKGRVLKNLADLSILFAASADRRFQFQKRGQLFIGVHNEALSVVAMCIRNPERFARKHDSAS